MVASGNMFGSDQPVILHLLDIEPAKQALDGVKMELMDGAYTLLHGGARAYRLYPLTYMGHTGCSSSHRPTPQWHTGCSSHRPAPQVA